MPVTLSWRNFHRNDTENIHPFMWDTRQIGPAEGPEKALVPLQEAKHTMKHFPKRPGSQSPACVCCWCWIWFFHVFSLKAEFLLHQLPLYHSFPLTVASKELRGRWDELLLAAPSWCRRKNGAASAAGFWVPAPGIVPTAWGNPGCPKFSTTWILAQDVTWMVNMAQKVCVHGIPIQPLRALLMHPEWELGAPCTC